MALGCWTLERRWWIRDVRWSLALLRADTTVKVLCEYTIVDILHDDLRQSLWSHILCCPSI